MEREAKGSPHQSHRREGAGRDDDQDEKQMEKFFVLVKNVKEMREQHQRAEAEKSSQSWKPAFQWEDFRGLPVAGKSPDASMAPGTSAVDGKETTESKKEQEATLDLNLSL